jgi:hypothetical protein
MSDSFTVVNSVIAAGEALSAVAVAVLLTNPASPAAAVGLTTRVTVLPPAPTLFKSQIMVPLLAPTASELHEPEPEVTAAETNVVLAGKTSSSSTFWAAPPALLTVMV